MEKTVDATFDGEVFRPDEPIELASNTKVKVIIDDEEPKKLVLVEVPKKGKGKPYAFFAYAMSINLDGPSDFSSNLDDYLYGGKSLDDAE